MNQNTFTPQSNIRISEYDYDLPDSRIARYPLAQRDLSKLLIYRDGNISENIFSSLPQYLQGNDLLVVNNTRVIHSRLIFRKLTGALIEIFCLEPHEPSDYQLALQAKHACQWKCIAGNLKKWKQDSLIKEIESPLGIIKLEASKKTQLDNHLIIEFTWDKGLTFAELLELTGETPIPPYLNRESEAIDKERYQTVYSLGEGSVAAPTAGLHFTDNVFEQLKAKNITTANVTLHVGAGTFKPVQTEYVREHEMHSEFFTVSKTTLENLMKNDRIVAVGTTSLRTLESLYWLSNKLKGNPRDTEIPELGQWDAYAIDSKLTYGQAMETLLEYMQRNGLESFSARTSMMILPGYQIKSAKALVTNFHQPKSTLLLLVSAFIGSDWKKVYAFALENNFRFLSYGDSSLLFRVG
jgi:S-adenosylmethionine:tRNA ribosyltransferase-isomerase